MDTARWGPMLEAAGIRVTSQRLLVLDVLAAHRLPVSAQQVHAELHDRGENIGLTTVYRALSSMTAARLVAAGRDRVPAAGGLADDAGTARLRR